MLVLERNLHEKVVITAGDYEIVVTLIDIRKGRKARIGFQALREVKILRGELRKDGE